MKLEPSCPISPSLFLSSATPVSSSRSGRPCFSNERVMRNSLYIEIALPSWRSAWPRVCYGRGSIRSCQGGTAFGSRSITSGGGRDSARKYLGLVNDIFSWFYISGGAVCVEEIENFLNESMLLTFNTEIEDGSIEEVAEFCKKNIITPR